MDSDPQRKLHLIDEEIVDTSKNGAPVTAEVGSTFTAEYIGSKRALLDFVTRSVLEEAGGGKPEILDLFSGTGVVSGAFKFLGFEVTANDHLALCFNLTASILLNHAPPTFRGLSERVPALKHRTTPYLAIIDHLNKLPGRSGGFVHKNYSPGSFTEQGIKRQYFTEENAKRIDAIRDCIESWQSSLTSAEHSLLLSDLTRAVSAVSNVAGTFGCYLKKWKSRALVPLAIQPSQFVGGQRQGHEVLCLEAPEVLKNSKRRIIYADPPYTKRQYAAYYHVLESIIRNDKPTLQGSTGLRNWKTHLSDFCYRKRALRSLEGLLELADCEHFFLSYNEDGQMQHDQIIELLARFGKVTYREIRLRRYRSSRRPHRGPQVAERIYHLSFV